ncbi:hypothetical protein MesoLj131c_30320 [Mesorhizobium sp. 131-3-5]|nr:hypothetical protein MesoLj131b_30130 [Mesorhizobium sp. 131-2-5]BCH08774.1 hypothetical protein MesoLj131c_30320 [Mesorhizobium sp. 131-3-5]
MLPTDPPDVHQGQSSSRKIVNGSQYGIASHRHGHAFQENDRIQATPQSSLPRGLRLAGVLFAIQKTKIR